MNKILIATALILALGSFQNCSDTSFTAASNSSGADGNAVSGMQTGSEDATGVLIQALSLLKPAMAVRSANCISCHGNHIASSLITDFAYGDNYFFNRNNGNVASGDWVYALRLEGSAQTPDWALAQQYTNGANIIVPRVNMGFQYSSLVPAGTPIVPWMTTSNLADMIRKIMAMPNAGGTPVVEMQSMYIGAPSVSQIRTHGGIDPSNPARYYKTSNFSYELSGMVKSGPVYTNNGIVNCDGDLFLEGTVFLNALQLKTINGCRIHATGPIFVQKAITYLVDPQQNQRSNLQLVSARLISMGVGDSHCEASTDPSGWYATTPGVSSPAALRFKFMSEPSNQYFKDVRTRNTNPMSNGEKTSVSPQAEGIALLALLQQVPGIQDASCTGRNVGFDHLLVNAPQIHSRYRGNFNGVIIGEFPLLSLGNFTFQFDPVFQTVPVLPKIPATELLNIQ